MDYFVTDNLRTRIVAALSGDLCRQQHAIDPDRDWQWFNMDALADAVIRELGLRIQVAGPDGIVGTGDYRYVSDFFKADDE